MLQETFRSCADISITGRQDEELKTGRDKIQTLKKLYLLMKKSEKVGAELQNQDGHHNNLTFSRRNPPCSQD